MWHKIAQHITAVSGQSFTVAHHDAVSGGCIHRAFKITNKDRCYFVKINITSALDMFVTESAGLTELARAEAIRVPQALCYGATNTHSYLVMEYIEFGKQNCISAAILGQQLAQMHQHTQPSFGWSMNNTIGSTPQINTQTDDWCTFWREQRLGVQLRLAKQDGLPTSLQQKGKHIQKKLALFFVEYTPVASLLHGDLWSGNQAVDSAGQAIIFDPAVYYGDRETDIAMTELFSGFPPEFYAAYQEAYPLDKGYPTRRYLYHLYHILNHAHLFGGAYIHQAEDMMDRLLAEY